MKERNMRTWIQRLLKPANQGFTMVEVIITVGVVAILVTLSVPALQEFLRQKDSREEITQMNEISKGFQAYLAANNPMPDDTITDIANAGHWANRIAPFTNVGVTNMTTDVWGSARTFVRYVRPETYLGTAVPINYYTIHSRGPNRVADGASNATGGIAVSGNAFDVPTSTNWWKGQTTDALRVQRFAEINPSLDDQLVRFTDYAEKVRLYNLTLERIQKIKAALETYGKQKYAEAIVASVANPERLIYVPMASVVGSPADDSTYYYGPVLTETSTYFGTVQQNILGGTTADATRRTNMITLMRVLGLPDETCCSALHTITGTTDELPFFYSSNPRPRLSSGCGTRPNPTAGTLVLPARITIVNDTNTCG